MSLLSLVAFTDCDHSLVTWISVKAAAEGPNQRASAIYPQQSNPQEHMPSDS